MTGHSIKKRTNRIRLDLLLQNHIMLYHDAQKKNVLD